MHTTNSAIQYNLNLDDLLPCYTDFSLLRKLVQVVPGIKVTIFMPVSSRDWGEEKNNILKHAAWCEQVAALPIENFELSFHGWQHHLADKTPEFKYLSREDAKDMLSRCEEAFTRMGLSYRRGFRPPVWEMSEGTARALEEMDYLYVSDSPRFYEMHKDIKIPRIFANDDIGAGQQYGEVRPFLSSGILPDVAKYRIQRGHLVSDLRNNLTLHTLPNILRAIRSLGDKVEFKFLSEIAEAWVLNST
jgi:peptidoglycan/xylan/chitin deacetylase (PgdA/CDA1 family)